MTEMPRRVWMAMLTLGFVLLFSISAWVVLNRPLSTLDSIQESRELTATTSLTNPPRTSVSSGL